MARQPQQSKAERLENLAFWYWEYQRRNPVYRRWSEVLGNLYEKLEPYQDTIDEIYTPNGTVDLIKYEREATTTHERKYNPARKVMEDRHGPKAGELLYKFNILSVKFDRKFKRPPLSHEFGVDTEEALKALLSPKELEFRPDDISHVSALLNMHNDWIVKIDGEDPNHTYMLLVPYVTLPIGPHVTTEIHQKATLEYEVLHLMSKTIDLWDFNEQIVDEQTADAALELLEDLKGINTANVMRLAMLWLWDRINEDDDQSLDFDGKFKKHWGSLKSRANNAGMIDKPWNQIYGKKNRIMKAFESTNCSIQNMTITDLNS